MTKREMAVHQEMLAENKAMRKCLEKTLVDLSVNNCYGLWNVDRVIKRVRVRIRRTLGRK